MQSKAPKRTILLGIWWLHTNTLTYFVLHIEIQDHQILKPQQIIFLCNTLGPEWQAETEKRHGCTLILYLFIRCVNLPINKHSPGCNLTNFVAYKQNITSTSLKTNQKKVFYHLCQTQHKIIVQSGWIKRLSAGPKNITEKTHRRAYLGRLFQSWGATTNEALC